MSLSTKTRKRIEVKGIVQGVGFRPFIYRLARKYELGGFVSNNNDGVEIEIEGTDLKIDEFIRAISSEAPPLSKIDELQVSDSFILEFQRFYD